VFVSLFAIAFSFIRQASYSKGNRLKFCRFVVPCNTVAVSVLPVTTVPATSLRGIRSKCPTDSISAVQCLFDITAAAAAAAGRI